MGATLPVAGCIGPNAITRVAEVLRRTDSERCTAIFDAAGLLHRLHDPPQQPVPEAEVQALHGALRAALGPEAARAVAAEAGRRTAAYLLQHRIPRPVQALLRRLPAGLASRVLLKAIAGHAWTFAGSGRFSAVAGPPVRLVIMDNPLCRGWHTEDAVCSFFAATFEVLFRTLVHPASRVAETACEARGDDACCFVVEWRSHAIPEHGVNAA
jgi:divinyl protochlorophyllide a 8-vinyl-reductase